MIRYFVIGLAVVTMLFAGVLLLGTRTPSETARFDAIAALNKAGMDDGWLALSEEGDENLPWQYGALAWEGDGPNLHLVIGLSDQMTHFAPGSDVGEYWTRFNDLYCHRIWPLVTNYLGRDFRVELYAWDRDLVMPDYPYGRRSALMAVLPHECTVGNRFVAN